MSQTSLSSPKTWQATSAAAPTEFRIVLIEDDAHIARLIEANLNKAKMQCWHSGDGRGGLRAIEAQKPHLVLLDLMLPDLNGYEVCARIRQTSNVPIIMITARSGPEYQMQGLQCGADDYVTKPFDPQLLMARVASQLRRTHRYNVAQEFLFETSPSADWDKCHHCGYMGPPEKFEELDDRFQLKRLCPHCSTSA